MIVIADLKQVLESLDGHREIQIDVPEDCEPGWHDVIAVEPYGRDTVLLKIARRDEG